MKSYIVAKSPSKGVYVAVDIVTGTVVGQHSTETGLHFKMQDQGWVHDTLKGGLH